MTGSPVRLGLPFVNRALSEFKRMPEVVGREVDWEAAVAQALARPAETTGSDLADGIQPSNVDVIDLAHSRQARRPRTAVIALSSAACLLLVAVGAAALARQESPSAATPPSGTSSVIDTSNAPTSPQPTTSTTSATTVSTPPPSSTPEITSVSAVTPAAQQTIVISGSGFGTLATPFVGSLPCFAVYNQTANWYAGHIDPLNSGRTSFGACDAPLSVFGDIITVRITDWTDTSITISGFEGAFGTGTFVMSPGDLLRFYVTNAQSGRGPATAEVVVSA